MVRIAEIESGSIADELRSEIGAHIVRINGQRVRDGIDLTLLLADNALELETVGLDGDAVLCEIEREPGEPIGIVPAPGTLRECGNKCVSCFIDGNLKDARDTVWLRDDDFRLSLTYGSDVTLPSPPGRTLRIVTGRSMEQLLGERAPRLAEGSDTDVDVLGVANDYYGETVTVAGLLAGRDIVRAVGETREDDLVPLPAEALNADHLLVDSVALGEVREAVAPAAVVTGYDPLESLRSAAVSARG